jgi:hypothetical protein
MRLVTVRRSNTRRQGLARALVIVSLASLLISACGSSSSPPSTSAPDSPAATAFKYASCMRKRGVPGYPDPQVTTNPDGSVAMAVAGPASASAAPAFRSAQKACIGILLAQSGGPGGPSRQAFLAFAHCLHTHGVADFPDPNDQGEITGEMIAASGVDLKARSFMAAADACVGVTHGAITRAGVARLINRSH